MKEAEWLACSDPARLLDYLQGKVRDRKLRLFACACCRRVWRLLRDERSKNAVEVAELFADGFASQEAVDRAVSLAFQAAEAAEPSTAHGMVYRFAAWAAANAINGHARDASGYAIDAEAEVAGPWPPDSKFFEIRDRECAAQSTLLRDICGGPRHLITMRPSRISWIDVTAVNIAEAIYTERAFDRLPILADALEDAGCTDGALLDHCRGGGEHVRGCWVIDLLTGRQ